MSDSEMSPASKTSDVHRLVMQPPFAWATFNGEGGYDLRLYEDNENYRERYIALNGDKYKGWVIPLYRDQISEDAL